MPWESWTFTRVALVWFVTMTSLSVCEASFHRISRSRRAINSVTVAENAAVGQTIFDLNDQDEAKPLSSYDFAVVNATGVSSVIFSIEDNKLKIRSASVAELNKFDRETNPRIRVNIEATKRSDPNVGRK
ncbi:hypothetical protein ElyMa_007011700 [Elysia marginata]|uniref:Cadherin domain-containing protein n=1 Tax=Elysia marginata TaxID=1093978 RepID=A0AAV4JRL7_9GAST|nr:hypothetical protein ElyMa_007011700 [Elysia marginata]